MADKEKVTEPEQEYAVNVDLMQGDDFTIVFRSRALAMDAIAQACQIGYVARDRQDDLSKHDTQFYPIGQVRRFSLHVPDAERKDGVRVGRPVRVR